jgi:hypothetical protein
MSFIIFYGVFFTLFTSNTATKHPLLEDSHPSASTTHLSISSSRIPARPSRVGTSVLLVIPAGQYDPEASAGQFIPVAPTGQLQRTSSQPSAEQAQSSSVRREPSSRIPAPLYSSSASLCEPPSPRLRILPA